MQEIRAEIRSLIDKHKVDINLSTNLNEEDLTSALIVIINRERKQVSEFALTKLAEKTQFLGTGE